MPLDPVPTSPCPPDGHAPARRRRWLGALAAAALVALGVLVTSVAAPLGGHRELTGREWQRLAADPGAHVGEQIVVFGVVTAPGAGTRRDVVRAAVDGLDRSDPDGYPTPAELRGADPALEVGDMFRADVTVLEPGVDGLALQVDGIRVLELG